jgi:hypothetical protein
VVRSLYRRIECPIDLTPEIDPHYKLIVEWRGWISPSAQRLLAMLPLLDVQTGRDA